MGGHSICHEPTQLLAIEEAHGILNRVGWLEYFEQLQGFDNEVAVEFMQNSNKGHAMVRNV